MLKFILQRLLILIPTLLGVILIVFFVMSLTPSSPGRIMLGINATQQEVDKIDNELHFHDPFLIKYGRYVIDAFQGNFGKSFITGQPVFDDIILRFPTSLKLTIACTIGGALIGIPLGILSAVKQYSVADYISVIAAMLLSAIPGFWFGLLLLLLFSLKLGWLPTSGIGEAGGGLTNIKYFIMPVMTLVLPSAGGLLRMTRSTMLETIREDYIRTARAKGAPERDVIWGHALQNALLPVITIIGMGFGLTLGGTILVESIFGMPGLGNLILTSIRSKDTMQVMADTIFLASFFMIVMLIVDVIYAYVDPRLKARFSK